MLQRRAHADLCTPTKATGKGQHPGGCTATKHHHKSALVDQSLQWSLRSRRGAPRPCVAVLALELNANVTAVSMIAARC